MRPPRRHLSRTLNRAIAAALLVAIDRLRPDHPCYAYWQALRPQLVVALVHRYCGEETCGSCVH